MDSERAVSEVLGYVLVIGIVTMMIGVVMTLGVSALYGAQSSEQTNNMERAFDVLADNFKQMHDAEAPSRATEVRLLDGHVRYGEPTTVNVTVDGELLGNLTVTSHPIVYDNEGGTTIAYDSGAVIREDGDHSIMLREPPWTVDAQDAVIPIVRTRAFSGTEQRQDGPATILVRGDGLRYDTATTTGDEVNITLESAYADAWESYFIRSDFENVTLEGNRITATVPGDSLNVSFVRQRIRITLQN